MMPGRGLKSENTTPPTPPPKTTTGVAGAMQSSPSAVATKTKEYRSPLQRITESKLNVHAGSIYSGAVRVLKRDKSPNQVNSKSHVRPHTNYMQPTASSKMNIASTPRKTVLQATPPRPQTPSRSVSPGKYLSTPETRRTSHHNTPKTECTTTPLKGVVNYDNLQSTPRPRHISEFSTPPPPPPPNTALTKSKKEQTKIIDTKTKPKSAPPSKHSRGSGHHDDVFSRLTQGLPTRHTTPPPTSRKPKVKRSASAGRLQQHYEHHYHYHHHHQQKLQQKPTHNVSSTTSSHHYQKRSKTPEKQKINSPESLPISQSLLRNSRSDPPFEMNQKAFKELHPRSLTSQLLLPSPPRDFISCVPEPPNAILPFERSADYKSYLQNLRDLIESGNHQTANDTTADSELTNITSSLSSPLRCASTLDDHLLSKWSQDHLFQSEVSIVEDSGSRSSSPRSLLSGSAWTTVSETFRPPSIVDSRNEFRPRGSQFHFGDDQTQNKSVDKNFLFSTNSLFIPRASSAEVTAENIKVETRGVAPIAPALGPVPAPVPAPTSASTSAAPHQPSNSITWGSQNSTFNNFLNSSTSSTCLSPTLTLNSINPLDQSIYIPQSEQLLRSPNNTVRRRDSGILSEDSAFIASSEFLSTEGQEWNLTDRNIEPLARLLENIEDDEEGFESHLSNLPLLPPPPPPPQPLLPHSHLTK